MEVSKGVRPEKIITDGLWQYSVTMSKEIASIRRRDYFLRDS